MAKTKRTASFFKKAYSETFGVLAGYLPQDKKHIDAWLATLAQKVKKQQKLNIALQPSVEALAQLINTNGIVRMYVTEMIDQVPPANKTVHNIDQLLQTLNYIITNAPEYNPDPAQRHFFPMSALFVYMMYTPAGEAAFRNTAFNTALRNILEAWCRFLDSPASQYVLNTGKYGWLSPSAYAYNKLDQFIIPDKNAPHWGFSSFNAYFHREIKPEQRPIAGPGDNRIIVSPNDGQVYDLQRKVKRSDTFWIKSQPYSLVNMLDNSPYTSRFEGGDVLQAFLSGANYHRWHAPVDGVIVEARVVPGLMFSELHVEGFDPDAGILSQGYETAVNTRGLIIIQNDDPRIGLVCVIPVGITEISSVRLELKNGQPLKKGMKVKKGDELGRFSYGGSTLATVFQPGAIKQFTVKKNDLINVNAKVAIADSI